MRAVLLLLGLLAAGAGASGLSQERPALKFFQNPKPESELQWLKLEPLNLGSLPEHPTVPWRCEAAPPSCGRQHWYLPLRQLSSTQQAKRREPLQQAQAGPGHPHTRMCQWLHQHFAERGVNSSAMGQVAAAVNKTASGFLEGLQLAARVAAGGNWGPKVSGSLPSLSQQQTAQQRRQQLSSSGGSSRLAASPEPEADLAPARRDYLVIAPVGDTFNASRWMDKPVRSTWDLVGIYYGYHADFTCSLCKKVYTGQGSKWWLLWGLYNHPDWQQMSQRYKAVMVVDENVALTTTTVNKAFAVMQEHNLLLAQPSVCRGGFPAPGILKQRKPYILRYTTFVQIMAPMFRMDFFDNVVGPSLYNAFTGFALDFVWVYLLRYPLDEVAVIDSACITQMDWMLQSDGSRKMMPPYIPVPTPYGAYEEELRRFAEYGYYASEVEALSGVPLYTDRLPFPKRLVKVLGSVHDPEYAAKLRALLSRTAIVCSILGACGLLAWKGRREKVKL